MDATNRPFSPEHLAADFGASSELARNSVHVLYEAISAAAGPKVEACFGRWQALLDGIGACRIDDASLPALAGLYGVPVAGLRPAELLFALHSYYATFLKLLAADVVAGVRRLPLPSHGIVAAETSGKARREMEGVERGGLLHRLTIANATDGDPFTWHTSAWSEPMERLAREMAATLAQYDHATLPAAAASRDLMGGLYPQLFPKSARRTLGEYYTPDWLAEHVLGELGYTGDPGLRVLDPACGSGTFLLTAINRIRRRSGGDCPGSCASNNGTVPLDGGAVRAELCRAILDNVIGFDLNPLAVLAASANYLVAIRDLIGLSGDVAVPVHLCDSILAPPPQWMGQCDFVAGNPPWIVWDRLAADYRDATKPLWVRYGLFTLGASAARHGGGKKDLSMLMLYAAADSCLKHGGKLGFVITQTAFQTRGAGDGFRRFRIGDDGPPLKVLGVDDMTGFQPFDGASNWTSVVILEKGAETVYPVPYRRWSLAGNSPRPAAKDWASCFSRESCVAGPIDRGKSSSPWLIRPISLDGDLDRLIGPSDYAAHSGACTGGANGVYWLRILGRADDDSVPLLGTSSAEPPPHVQLSLFQTVEHCNEQRQLRVQNLSETSKGHTPTVERVIEPDLLYPLLRWSDVSRYRATPSCYLLLAQDPLRRTGIDESVMRASYPNTLAYLSEFREKLLRRVAYRRYQGRGPFYSMYDVGPYTIAPVKVVWRRMDRRINAAVVEPHEAPYLGLRPVIPQETCVLIETQSSDEAHYLCAVLNSAVTNFIIRAHSVRGGKGFGTPGVLDYLRLRRFQPDDPRHQELASLSRQAHAAVAGEENLGDFQLAIDQAAADLAGLTRSQLDALRRHSG